ncbi:MAG: ribosome recycling factor [Leptonema sp. (in: Bacteria)]|nr:ribosome recycling factor [Leptonema sp. (in: bacteria)]
MSENEQSDNIVNNAKSRMDRSLENFKRELNTIRSSRANPAMLDGLTAEYYGAETPLNQLATISVPEARMILISPFDKSTLGAIEKSILKSDLNLTPSNDGTVIRLMLPEMTMDRRQELVKQVKQRLEETKVAIRNVRRDANDDLKKLTQLSKDEQKHYQDEIQKLTDGQTLKADEIAKEKEESILKV